MSNATVTISGLVTITMSDIPDDALFAEICRREKLADKLRDEGEQYALDNLDLKEQPTSELIEAVASHGCFNTDFERLYDHIARGETRDAMELTSHLMMQLTTTTLLDVDSQLRLTALLTRKATAHVPG